MSLARQYFSIILIISVNIFSSIFIGGMEKPSRTESLQEKQDAAREKKTQLKALKIKQALRKDLVLQAAEKELKISSGKSSLDCPVTIIIQNNFASPVSVGLELKTIMPKKQKTVIVDFNKITHRLGHFELPIYDSENTLIAQLVGFRNKPITEKKSHCFGTQFSTFYAGSDDSTVSPNIDGEKNYRVYLELSGAARIMGEMELAILYKDNISHEEKNNRPVTSKIPISVSTYAVSENQGSKQTKNSVSEADKFQKSTLEKPMQGISVSQSSTSIENKKPAFPAARRAFIAENGPTASDDSQGSLLLLKNATLRTIKRTGSLIKLIDDPKDHSENAKNKAAQ